MNASPSFLQLIAQPSSLAGFGILAANVAATSSVGMPTSTLGWLSFAASLFGGIVAVLRNDGSHNAS